MSLLSKITPRYLTLLVRGILLWLTIVGLRLEGVPPLCHNYDMTIVAFLLCSVLLATVYSVELSG